jgi:hypothetical protein
VLQALKHTVKLLPGPYAFRARPNEHVDAEGPFCTPAGGTSRAVPLDMEDDVRNDATARPAPTLRTCPQCLNPHTVVAEERYRGVMRFCPMCDFSWVIGQVNDEGGRPKRGDSGR